MKLLDYMINLREYDDCISQVIHSTSTDFHIFVISQVIGVCNW